MSARFDKYDSAISGTRVPSNADVSSTDFDKVLGVSVNASGKGVLKAAGNTGFIGVAVVDRTTRKAGAILDVMQTGEIIVQGAGLVAGTTYYLTSGGLLTATQAGSVAYVGFTVEADRLVVRFRQEVAA